MEIKINFWSFYLILLCLCISCYSLYTNIYNTWIISPPNYILFFASISGLIGGTIGLKDKRNVWPKLRSWFTVILSILLMIVLFLSILMSLFASSFGENEKIKTIHSPDYSYTIDFYRWDAGAAGTFGVRGEINGPLWFKKRIYNEKRTDTVDVLWITNDKVSINSHVLDLKNGDTYGY